MEPSGGEKFVVGDEIVKKIKKMVDGAETSFLAHVNDPSVLQLLINIPKIKKLPESKIVVICKVKEDLIKKLKQIAEVRVLKTSTKFYDTTFLIFDHKNSIDLGEGIKSPAALVLHKGVCLPCYLHWFEDGWEGAEERESASQETQQSFLP